jgi:hypothetical protein
MEEKRTGIYHPGAGRWLRRSLLANSTRPIARRWSRVPAGAALDRSLSSTDLRTLILLSRYTGAEGICYVSQSTLAKLRGVSRQMIAKSLDRLREAKWITSQDMYRPDSMARTSSAHTVHYKSMPDEPLG